MNLTSTLTAEWFLPSTVTLGSSVRATGIERELRRKLPWGKKKSLTVEGGHVALAMPATSEDFEAAAAMIDQALLDIPSLLVLPSEAEDILSISSRERHKWMGDGRLQSAGMRTVKLRGRSKPVTFHVFDPRHIEHFLDSNLPEIWRAEDIATSAENRRRAAGKAALTRAGKRQAKSTADPAARDEISEAQLEGWEEFAAEGLLR